MTPAGVATEHPIPSQVSTFPPVTGARDLTLGPDANVWFTEMYPRGGVGRVTPDGIVTEFSPPPELSGYWTVDITNGPQDALWVSSYNGLSRGLIRITVTGTYTLLPLPGGDSSIGDICSGSDGNLWLAFGTNTILRVAPSGAYQSFLVPGPASSIQGVASGPDGNIWFTLPNQNAIGRLSLQAATEPIPVLSPVSLSVLFVLLAFTAVLVIRRHALLA